MKNKKGIIFALDGAIAVTIVLIMLINTTYYFTTTSQESLSQTQIIKRGYDVIAMFDEFEELDDAFKAIVSGDIPKEPPNELNVTKYLPRGYNMTVYLTDALKNTCSGDCTLEGTGITSINTASLSSGGNYYIQVNAKLLTTVGTDPKFTIEFPTNTFYEFTTPCNVNVICTLTTLLPVDGLQEGVNSIEFVHDGTDNFEIYWMKVLDHPDYILSTGETQPTTRFIGTGERWFASFDDNGHFAGMHKARFKVWLE
jgi:hypothetical protein